MLRVIWLIARYDALYDDEPAMLLLLIVFELLALVLAMKTNSSLLSSLS